jgi:hypothetical protein
MLVHHSLAATGVEEADRPTRPERKPNMVGLEAIAVSALEAEASCPTRSGNFPAARSLAGCCTELDTCGSAPRPVRALPKTAARPPSGADLGTRACGVELGDRAARTHTSRPSATPCTAAARLAHHRHCRDRQADDVGRTKWVCATHPDRRSQLASATRTGTTLARTCHPPASQPASAQVCRPGTRRGCGRAWSTDVTISSVAIGNSRPSINR